MSQMSARKVAMGSFIGTAIEWYDFFIFGTAAALVFPQLFFPEADPLAGTLLSFATFALAFVVRPIGGVIFGHFGDRIGRKKLLVVSLGLMGAATTAIGFLPTYASIGVAAPLLLVLLRVLQGLSVGGEYGGAVLMATEHATPGRRGFYGSWVQMGSPAGLICANAAWIFVSQLSEEALMSWGWRVPFLLGSVLLFTGLVIRMKLTESPSFERARQTNQLAKVPILVVLKEYKWTVLLVAGAQVGVGPVFYISSVFGLKYGSTELGFTRTDVLTFVIIGQLYVFFAVPLFAHLSDRVGYRKVFNWGLIGMALMSLPWLWLFGTGSYGIALLGFLLLYTPYSATWGTMATFFANVFPTRIGYSGLSLGYQLGTIVGGGLTPLAAAALYGRYQSILPVAMLMVAGCVLSFACATYLVQQREDEHGVLADPAVTPAVEPA